MVLILADHSLKVDEGQGRFGAQGGQVKKAGEQMQVKLLQKHPKLDQFFGSAFSESEVRSRSLMSPCGQVKTGERMGVRKLNCSCIQKPNQ